MAQHMLDNSRTIESQAILLFISKVLYWLQLSWQCRFLLYFNVFVNGMTIKTYADPLDAPQGELQLLKFDTCSSGNSLPWCLWHFVTIIQSGTRKCCQFANSSELCHISLCHHKCQRIQVMIWHCCHKQTNNNVKQGMTASVSLWQPCV